MQNKRQNIFHTQLKPKYILLTVASYKTYFLDYLLFSFVIKVKLPAKFDTEAKKKKSNHPSYSGGESSSQGHLQVPFESN